MKEKKFLESPNFWLAVIIVIGGFFVGFPQEDAAQSVTGIFALIGGGGLLLKFFRDKPKVDVTPWVKDANFWNYLSVIAVAVTPEIAQAILPAAKELTLQVLKGNYGGAIMGAVSLVTIIVKLIQANKPKEQTA